MNNFELAEKLRHENFVFKTVPAGSSWPTPSLSYYNSNCAISTDTFDNTACKSKTDSAICLRVDGPEHVKLLLRDAGGLEFRAGSSSWFVYKGTVEKSGGSVDEGKLRGANLSYSFLIAGQYHGYPVEFVGGELVYLPEEISRELRSAPAWWR
jgi:hypothetical protein